MGIRDGDVEDLIARNSLLRLVTTYSRAVDRRDFALLRSLYHDDACERHGTMFEGGPDDYVAFVAKAISAYEATAHYVVNASFAVEGDYAEGEIYKINYHRTPPPDAYEIVTGSRSLDCYRREQGEWKFLARTITLDWAERREVDSKAYRDFAARSPLALPGEGDLSYSVLPFFGRHPT